MGDINFNYIPLSEFSTRQKRLLKIEPHNEYKTLGCRLYGNGIYQRETKKGIDILAKKMYLVKENDLVINRIWAQKGSVGIVPKNISDSIVTADFPVFELNNDFVVPEYIAWYLKTSNFWNECKKHSYGTSGRQRISPEEIPKLLFPICELSVQKEIIVYLTNISNDLSNAIQLNNSLLTANEYLWNCSLYKSFNSDPNKDVMKKISNISVIKRGKSPKYQDNTKKIIINQKCVRKDGINLSYAKEVNVEWFNSLKNDNYFQKDDVVVNSTGEGTIGRSCVVSQNAIGLPFDSHILVVRVNNQIVPKYLNYFLQSPLGQKSIQQSKGAKTTKQTELGVKKLGRIEINLPSIDLQNSIVSFLDNLKTNSTRFNSTHSIIGEELDLILPNILQKIFTKNTLG